MTDRHVQPDRLDLERSFDNVETALNAVGLWAVALRLFAEPVPHDPASGARAASALAQPHRP